MGDDQLGDPHQDVMEPTPKKKGKRVRKEDAATVTLVSRRGREDRVGRSIKKGIQAYCSQSSSNGAL